MGKISYSQFSQWDKCPQMWKLNYVDKAGTFTGNIFTIKLPTINSSLKGPDNL